MQKHQVAQWFMRQPQLAKNLTLLYLAWELTLVVRGASLLPETEHERKLAVGRSVSECQHKMLSYVTSAMTGADRYPDELIIDFACDYVDSPTIENMTRGIWELIIPRVEKSVAAINS